MTFNPQKHHRRSIRLPAYDYTQPGAYFITMVTYRRAPLFGEILNGVMRLSAMGKIADEHWLAIPEHFPQAELGAYVVMPDHMHGIIILRGTSGGTIYRAPTSAPTAPKIEQFQKPVPGSIPTILRSYKASVTRRIQERLDMSSRNPRPVWQRNYYEHVIRSEAEHGRIHRYIEANVERWAREHETPGRSA